LLFRGVSLNVHVLRLLLPETKGAGKLHWFLDADLLGAESELLYYSSADDRYAAHWLIERHIWFLLTASSGNARSRSKGFRMS
jgi:hypothetical protein